jgi:hypothetical protein
VFNLFIKKVKAVNHKVKAGGHVIFPKHFLHGAMFLQHKVVAVLQGSQRMFSWYQ